MGFSAIISILWFIFIIGGLAVLIIWLVVMNRALDQISHDIRKMEPGAVWLCLIPLFGLVWQFMVTNAVASGIAGEFAVRNMFPKESKPGAATGTTGCILMCCCIIPYAGIGIALIGLVFMIVHIAKISEYNKALNNSGRWETRYHERMALLKQQQQITWVGMQQPYQQAQNFQQPQRSTYISQETKLYQQKEKPKNPFE